MRNKDNLNSDFFLSFLASYSFFSAAHSFLLISVLYCGSSFRLYLLQQRVPPSKLGSPAVSPKMSSSTSLLLYLPLCPLLWVSSHLLCLLPLVGALSVSPTPSPFLNTFHQRPHVLLWLKFWHAVGWCWLLPSQLELTVTGTG